MKARRCFYCKRKTHVPIFDERDVFEGRYPHSVLKVADHMKPLCAFRKS